MSSHVCRHCAHRPPRPVAAGRGGAVVCGHCGSVMQRRSPLSGGAALVGSLALLGLSLAALPDAFDGLAMVASGTPGLSRVVARLDPPPDPDRRPLALLQGDLFDRLAESDLAWVPTAESLPGGGTRYSFRRRLGEPEPSLAEIKRMMIQPPDHSGERASIALLLQELERAGVALEITRTRKPGAAGEWDHASRTMRLQPIVLEKGTVEFLRVLNHESIHVAQSCAGGGLRARPRPLGLSTTVHPELARHLADPMYAASPPEEKLLEREAYANQHRDDLGAALVRQHCRGGAG